MKIVKWLDDNLEEKLMALFLWAIVVIMGIQVIMRYVVRSSLSWSEEVSRYLFVWMVFIGISYGVKKGSHMRIDMLEHFFPKLKNVLGILADACFLAFAVIMIKPGIKVINAIKLSGQTSPAAGIPMHYVYTVLLIGFSLVIIRTVQKYVLMFIKKGAK